MAAKNQIASFVVLSLALAAANLASAAPIDPNDHLECFRIQDPRDFRALVDLKSPQFGIDYGCEVTMPAFFCAPARKRVRSALSDGKPIKSPRVFGRNAGYRICYQLKCPPRAIPNDWIIDQFGGRSASDFELAMLCTPASPERDWCGNGHRGPNEECDGGDKSQCGGAPCRRDCTCACKSVCCYIEGIIAVNGCIEYTAPHVLTQKFLADCAKAKSAPTVYAAGVPSEEKCSIGPVTGVPCVAGATVNALKVPPDTRCP
jgi:hypothetical protein